MNALPTKRRLFITENSLDFYKLFNVKQGSEMADLYFSWPDSGNTKFMLLDTRKEEIEFRSLDASNNGRLSFHATGQVHFAEEGIKARREFVVKGNQLFNPNKNEIGMRHLFTGFIAKPTEKRSQTAPPIEDTNDNSFLTTDFSPAIIMFFAVPNGYSVNLEMKVSTDHFKVPDHLPGMGTFVFKHHSLFWVAYQQIHLSWPKHNHIAYSDGHCVPLFIGKENNTMDLLFIEPQYELTGQTLTIRIDQEKILSK